MDWKKSIMENMRPSCCALNFRSATSVTSPIIDEGICNKMAFTIPTKLGECNTAGELTKACDEIHGITEDVVLRPVLDAYEIPGERKAGGGAHSGPRTRE